MPGQDETRRFSLTSTYVPTGERNNLAAFVAVNADPRTRTTAQFRVLQLPRSAADPGPGQVQNTVRVRRRGRRTSSTSLSGGNVQVELRQPADAARRRRAALRRAGLRAGGGRTPFPLLRKVLVSLRRQDRVRGHAAEALDSLFAQQGTGNPDTSGGGTTATATAPATGGRRGHHRQPGAEAGSPLRGRRRPPIAAASRTRRRATSRRTGKRRRTCRARCTGQSRRERGRAEPGLDVAGDRRRARTSPTSDAVAVAVRVTC